MRCAASRGRSTDEVAFVLASDSPDHDVEIRFFSPQREVTFIGHAAVAAHYVRAIANGVPKGKVRQKSGNWIIEVEVTGQAPNLHVAMHQSPATFGPAGARRAPRAVLDALGISSASLHPSCPMQVMSKCEFAPADRAALARDARVAAARTCRRSSTSRRTSARTASSCSRSSRTATRSTTESRMFCPVIGVPEDPVSGNAHGMLGVYLVHHGLLAANGKPARLVGHQGRFVRATGQVEVQVTASGKRATGRAGRGRRRHRLPGRTRVLSRCPPRAACCDARRPGRAVRHRPARDPADQRRRRRRRRHPRAARAACRPRDTASRSPRRTATPAAAA